ncbi:CRISPR-associated protein Cas2 [Vibrio crassostreae]|uniref:SinR family protein n=1 Tax=Vibrio coralliirubri TaxID=1516159 RepID=A0AA86X0A7_9VIBR|nr:MULTISPECIES: hypothetical protein [Vibrio]CAK2025266.1 CRISPR-associated protein Cas2 [Vibrio crassostreae]CAK2816516.1 CRISPR-associated protein Cas2 [Vibrio crassostreae]CAK2834966.1 CRISPR-associated protein Cas2 [Vibrio crassostreae]CDT81936.1 conserved hypothetical protein [Vibrio coralliirubri]
MAVYSVSYDLNAPGKKYEDIYKILKSFSGWNHIMESTWLISTNLTPSQVLEKFKPQLDSNDRMFVSKVYANQYSGWLSDKQWEWLTNNV